MDENYGKVGKNTGGIMLAIWAARNSSGKRELDVRFSYAWCVIQSDCICNFIFIFNCSIPRLTWHRISVHSFCSDVSFQRSRICADIDDSVGVPCPVKVNSLSCTFSRTLTWTQWSALSPSSPVCQHQTRPIPSPTYNDLWSLNYYFCATAEYVIFAPTLTE